MADRGVLRVVRDGKLTLTLPGPSCVIKADGTIWCSGFPILGMPEKKAELAQAVREQRWDDIPTEAYTRLGDNSNGLWAGWDDEWATHPAKIAADQVEATRKAQEAKSVSIYLSSRGWGDWSPCEWVGDITRPDDEILAECRKALTDGHDVDQRNQSDDEILEKITSAREAWRTAPEREAAREKAAAEDIQRKIESGYCFYCESWCHGDCGHYSNDPQVKFRRDYRQAVAEENYGITD